ncbi:MAG TPA: HisA/HisF-related TIM barrel protein [Gammaproteobacteria bacterium]|nr:HisA/HisF-related TIM barrel protein [Gammaproteobacteria bacterium]
MHIVPVIDIKAGQAVRAIAGQRRQYRPLTSKLCNSSELSAVLESLRSLYAFDTFYLADIDRIMGWGDNRATIDMLCDHHQELAFWLDAGFSQPEELAWLEGRCNITPVLGSESIGSLDKYRALRQTIRKPYILSLDYLQGRFRGPAELEHHPELWPDAVLVMELDRVGTGAGPHYCRLTEHPVEGRHYRIYAAGGVRGIDDLLRLEEAHVDGVLVATALHDGRLDRGVLIAAASRASN